MDRERIVFWRVNTVSIVGLTLLWQLCVRHYYKGPGDVEIFLTIVPWTVGLAGAFVTLFPAAMPVRTRMQRYLDPILAVSFLVITLLSFTLHLVERLDNWAFVGALFLIGFYCAIPYLVYDRQEVAGSSHLDPTKPSRRVGERSVLKGNSKTLSVVPQVPVEKK